MSKRAWRILIAVLLVPASILALDSTGASAVLGAIASYILIMAWYISGEDDDDKPDMRERFG